MTIIIWANLFVVHSFFIVYYNSRVSLLIQCQSMIQCQLNYYYSARFNQILNVQLLVDAKADLDIETVNDARLFACPATLESPNAYKPRKHPLKFVSCAVVFVCNKPNDHNNPNEINNLNNPELK